MVAGNGSLLGAGGHGDRRGHPHGAVIDVGVSLGGSLSAGLSVDMAAALEGKSLFMMLSFLSAV